MEWNEIEALQGRLRRFAEQRDWDQFHSPKNLAMALTAEVGELLEHFQWMTESQSAALPREKLAEVADEIADVQIYLARLADKLQISIGEAVERKEALNEQKYRQRRFAAALRSTRTMTDTASTRIG